MATMAFTPLIPRNFYEVAKFIATLLENAVEERLAAKSRSKHPVWVYFARLDRTNAICLLCSCPVKSACSTNLARHIANHHPSTALEMRKAWLAGRDRAPGGVVSAGVGVSTVPSPSAAIAAISPDCEEEEEKMNCDSTDPSYPLLVNPYSSAAMMGNPLGQPLLTVGLSDITGGCSWLPYQDLRTLDGTTAYETELTLGCQDLSSAPKYETVKYDYTEIQTPEKAFDTEPRLYHKAQEEIKPEEDAEKDEKSQNGDSTPVKRGRPTENPCWNYFFRLDDQNVRCKLCSKVVKSACATNMTKHLERHHQHDYQHLIVQIRQYRSSKGPLLSSSSDLAHLLPSNYVKTEYPDIYSTSPVDASELAVYPQTSYERALQDSGIWNRQPWNQWQTGQPLETATIDARTSGVIIHGNSQSWASTSTSSSSSGGGGPEKPYMKRNRMTVNYNLCVSNSSPLSLFKLLLRWKGSIWKAVWIEYLFFLLAFNVFSCFYRYVLTGTYQQYTTNLIMFIHEGLQKLPMEFMLGFFVQVIVNRWSVLYANIGFIDTLALTISSYVTGRSDQERLWRRNIVRYCVLSQVIVFRDISMQVRNRFPTMDTVVAAGIMMPHEQEKFEEFQNGYGKPWMPFQWALSTLRKARKHGSIGSDYLLEKCCEQVRIFRNSMALLNNYDICPIPISYPQIVFLAVYVHFALGIIGYQPIVNREFVRFGLHFPLMSSLKFLFYMGWLKVAEALLNPFGEDDDDFETNFLIDRNLAIGFAIVDRCYDDPPAEIPDTLWSDDAAPLYSEQSASRTANPMEGSVSNIELPENVQTVHMIPRPDNAEGSVKSKTVSVRRNSRLSRNSTGGSLRKRTVSWKHAPPSYEQNVSTIDEIEMDEISLDSPGKTHAERTVTRH